MKGLAVFCRGLEVYRTLLTKGGRILFEVAVDFVDTHNQWQEVIRLWVSPELVNANQTGHHSI